MSHIGKRLNERFLASYIELDRNCCEKFDVSVGGVTEYVNRLNNARFAPGREEALPRLVRYRNIRNKMAHELGTIRKTNDVTGADLKWIRTFNKDITKRRDPISKYLKKARRYARRRKIQKYVTVFAIIAAFIIGIVTYFLLTK